VLSGRGLCDELITRPEESYRLWCVVVCYLETSRICAPYIYGISSLSVNSSLEVNLRPRNTSFRGPTHKPFVQSRRSVHTEPTYDGEFPQVSLLLPKETALRHVFRWSNLAKERQCFRPRCCHSTAGRALYCKWLNSSTGIVNTVQCASSSLSRLQRNLKIVFTF